MSRAPTSNVPRVFFSGGNCRATVFDAWRALSLPGTPSWACLSPFGSSGELNFMIMPDGRSWFDFDRRDQGGLDRFLQLALGVSPGEARWLVRELDRGGTLEASSSKENQGGLS